MPAIQAYCHNCDRWFPSVFGLIEDATNVTITGMNMICGKCGGSAPVIDGVYNAIGDTIEIVKSHNLTTKELKTLTRIIQQAIVRNTPAGQIREIIAREVPKAKSLNRLVADNAGLVVVLTLILGVLQNITPFLTATIGKPEKEKITNAVLESKTTSYARTTQKWQSWCK